MQFSIISILTIVAAATTVAAMPADLLTKRDFGCSVWNSNDKQCSFHCRNDVEKKCRDGSKIHPVGGECGGPLWATCICNYNKNCPKN